MDGDPQEIRRALAVLFESNDTIELRSIDNDGRILSGFFRDVDKLASEAERLSSETFSPPQSVYVCLNRLQPEVYARRAEQVGWAGKGGAVSDSNITSRRWLLVDVDPIRPAKVSATDEQKHAAAFWAGEVYEFLAEQLGKDCLVCADSGNGSHILIRLPDVENTPKVKRVCEQFLAALAEQFDCDSCKVDRTPFNAARVAPLYGTMKRKGSSIPEQPHRPTKLLQVPETVVPCDWDKLVDLAGTVPSAPQPDAAQPSSGQDIDALLQLHRVDYQRDDDYQTASGEQATRYVLDVCPFNEEHNDRAAYVLKWGSGSIAFGCHHDGCKGKDWAALQRLWELPGEVTADDIQLPPAQPIIVMQTPALEIVSSLDTTGGCGLAVGSAYRAREYQPVCWAGRDRQNLLSLRPGKPHHKRSAIRAKRRSY